MEQPQDKMCLERAQDFPGLDSTTVRPMPPANSTAWLLDLRRSLSETDGQSLYQLKQRLDASMSPDTFEESFGHIVTGSIVSAFAEARVNMRAAWLTSSTC